MEREKVKQEGEWGVQETWGAERERYGHIQEREKERERERERTRERERGRMRTCSRIEHVLRERKRELCIAISYA